MELRMSFEIKKISSNERITSIEADSFKEAINEFSQSYDVTANDKYIAISGENKIEFHFKEDMMTAILLNFQKN